jgi:hypothetical protein
MILSNKLQNKKIPHHQKCFQVKLTYRKKLIVCLMVFNATSEQYFSYIVAIILLVEETEEPGENHRPAASHRQTLSHNVVHLALLEIRTHISGDRH